MTDLLPQIALVAFLVVVNAAFAGTELALVSLREGQLQRLERRSASGRTLASLARDPNRFLATIQIGITLAGFLASASAAVSLSAPLEESLAFLGGAAAPASIVLVTLVLSYVTLVFGELAPKRVAMQRAEGWGLMAARPLALLAEATRPAVWLLSRSADVAVRLIGGDPRRQREDVTEEEIRDMVAVQVSFTAQQRLIIDGAFEIAQRTLNEVLRPRRDVVVLHADAPSEDAIHVMLTSGHSRAPVAENGDLDTVVGIVHLRDLIGHGGIARDRAAPAMFFPETAAVLDAMRSMQQNRQQMAICLNEHGGADGIVTIEDLVEELVGEIYDETDRDVLSLERQADGTLVVPGRFPIHDLKDVGVSLPDGDYTTVAGAVLAALGHIPDAPGETVSIGDWNATVLAVDARAITRVRLHRRGVDDQPGEA